MTAGSSNPKVNLKTIRILGICVLIGILIYLLTKNTQGSSVAVKDDHLALSYSSGPSVIINYKDVLSVAETGALDTGKYVSGIETKSYKFGIWDNGEFGKYHLCIYTNVTRYIVVKASTGTFVLNFDSVGATDSF